MKTVFNEFQNYENMQAKADLNTAIVRRIYKLYKSGKLTHVEALEAAKLLYVSTQYNDYERRHNC